MLNMIAGPIKGEPKHRLKYKFRVLPPLRRTSLWSGQEGPPGVTKCTKETRRPTKKTNLDKHFCGLSNLKKYWPDTKKTKHTKTFL